MRLAEGFTPSPIARGSFWASDTGVLVYRTGGVDSTRKLTWLGRDGRRADAAPPDLYESFRLSPDGQYLLIAALNPATKPDIAYLRIPENREPSTVRPTPFQDTRFEEDDGRFSPDGRWVAFTSDENGKTEVYVDSFPKPSGKQPISIAGGERPEWSADGRRLYFRAGDKMMSVAIQTSPSFVAGTPEVLFTVPKGLTIQGCVPAVDGRFFCEVAASAATPSTPAPRTVIHVVVNWMTGMSN